MMKHIIGIVLSIAFVTGLCAQDKVLFSVNEQPVHISEFDYIYKKNNGDQATYSKESIDEYLDLYIKFKLKVAAAKEMKLDTLEVLQQELMGYRDQLANSYLMNKEILNLVVDETYRNMQYDYKVRHFLAGVSNPDNKDKVGQAEEKIYNAHERIVNAGLDFAEITKGASDDPTSRTNEGMVGWLTAPMPEGFYEFEKQMANVKINEVSKPFKSALGYHILRVEDKRPARGKMEVAQIVIYKTKNGRPVLNARESAQQIYLRAQNGESFAKLAKDFSDDKNTAETGGYMGFFGINEYDINFENAAFSLTKDGAISEPVETSLGWHLIKRISKKDLKDEHQVKAELRKKLQGSGRLELALNTKVEEIKGRSNFSKDDKLIKKIYSIQTNDFGKSSWQKPEASEQIVFRYGNDIVYTESQTIDYLKDETLKRQKYVQQYGPQMAAFLMIEDLMDSKALEYEKMHLEENYAEFAALMREYEEGVLLFEVTKQNVWDKASSDTTGLRSFYERNKQNYKWGERAKVGIYTVHSDDPGFLTKVNEFISAGNPEIVINTVNSDGKKLINYTEKVVERNSDLFANQEVTIEEEIILPGERVTKIIHVLELLPSAYKTLDEAKGYVIADYQEELETAWLAQLSEKYKVKVNKSAKKSLIK